MTTDDPRDQRPGDHTNPTHRSPADPNDPGRRTPADPTDTTRRLPGGPTDPGEQASGGVPSAAAMSADELASALLDGEITGPEAAAARRRPDVATRLARLDAVRSAVRRAPLPDPGARERAIAAALAAYDHAAGPTPHRSEDRAADVPEAGRVTPLQRRPPARRRPVPRWLGAAAAAAVVAAGIAGLAVIGSSSDDEDTAATDAAAEESATDDASGAAEAPATDDETAEAEGEGGGNGRADAAGPLDLGEYASVDDLAGAVPSLVARDTGDGEAATAPSATTDGDESQQGAGVLQALCPSPPGTVAAGDATVVLQGRATVAGAAVDVYLVDDPSGRRLVVVDAGCTVVADQALD
jgi:negative regulator of sigma E activity